MADLIDKDVLLKEYCTDCNSGIDKPCPIPGRCNEYVLIKNFPAVNRWIPVEDALPENNEIVLVCLYWGKDAYVRKGYIKNEVWYTADGYRMWIIP